MNRKRIVRWIVVGALAAGLGCSGKPAEEDRSTPGGVVRTFYDLLDAGSYTEAKALYAAETRALVDEPDADAGFRSWADQETRHGTIRDVEILETTPGEETASVRFEIRYEDGSSVERQVDLVREEGQWRLGLIA